MKLRVILSLVVIAITLSSFTAEKDSESPAVVATTTISGSVIDQATGELLVGVEVELEGANQKVYTDFDGNYSFSNVKSGTYKIATHLISYKDANAQEITVAQGNTKKVNLKLNQID